MRVISIPSLFRCLKAPIVRSCFSIFGSGASVSIGSVLAGSFRQNIEKNDHLLKQKIVQLPFFHSISTNFSLDQNILTSKEIGFSELFKCSLYDIDFY